MVKKSLLLGIFVIFSVFSSSFSMEKPSDESNLENFDMSVDCQTPTGSPKTLRKIWVLTTPEKRKTSEKNGKENAPKVEESPKKMQKPNEEQLESQIESSTEFPKSPPRPTVITTTSTVSSTTSVASMSESPGTKTARILRKLNLNSPSKLPKSQTSPSRAPQSAEKFPKRTPGLGQSPEFKDSRLRRGSQGGMARKLSFGEATVTLNFSRVSINLMWVNKIAHSEQQYIYNATNQSELKTVFLDKVFKWSEAFPESNINVWYDSKLVSKGAGAETLKLIDKFWLEKHHMSNNRIYLRDIWESSKVRENEDVFSEKVVVYFRVDLLRPIIALYELTVTKEADYFVYADLDMEERPSPTELFNEENMRKIKESGILMAKLPVHDGAPLQKNYENSFQVISGDNQNLIDAMQWALIDVCIAKARNALIGNFSRLPIAPMKALTEAVYIGYQDMFKYFDFLEGRGALHVVNRITMIIPIRFKVTGRNTVIIIPEHEKIKYSIEDEYDKTKYGLIPFDLDGTKEYRLLFVPTKHYHSLIIEYLDELALVPVIENIAVKRSNIGNYKDLLFILDEESQKEIAAVQTAADLVKKEKCKKQSPIFIKSK